MSHARISRLALCCALAALFALPSLAQTAAPPPAAAPAAPAGAKKRVAVMNFDYGTDATSLEAAPGVSFGDALGGIGLYEDNNAGLKKVTQEIRLASPSFTTAWNRPSKPSRGSARRNPRSASS